MSAPAAQPDARTSAEQTGFGPDSGGEPGLVSVVVPARDEERFIGEALESVLRQNYAPLEMIVVDDGSQDRTAQIAADSGAHVLRQRNAGPAAARNAGLAAARGEFWTIFDADDVMPPDRIACQVKYLREHPEVEMVLGLTEAFTTPGEPRPPYWNPAWDAGPYHGHPGTTMARRRVLTMVGPFNPALRWAEDLDWLARAHEAGVRTGQVDQLCLRYRVHAGNVSANTMANRGATLTMLREAVHRRKTRSVTDAS